MTKVHPNLAAPETEKKGISVGGGGGAAVVLTVWRKSLLFNGNGFAVFDAKGNLVFRVDNYASENKGEIVLMDATGNPLLTIRRKRLSLADHWLIYHGEENTNPIFSVKKNLNFLRSMSLAHVTLPAAASSSSYEVEGSYSRRSCAVLDGSRRQLAAVKRKEAIAGVAFGVDVFRLVVEPGFDAAVAMAFVILLEQMFGSRSSLLKG